MICHRKDDKVRKGTNEKFVPFIPCMGLNPCPKLGLFFNIFVIKLVFSDQVHCPMIKPIIEFYKRVEL